jgi:transposase
LLARKKFTVIKLSTYNAALRKLRKKELWQNEMLTTAGTYSILTNKLHSRILKRKRRCKQMVDVSVRKLIIQAHADGMGATEIARVYRVTRKTVYNLVEHEKRSGQLAADMSSVGRKPALDETGLGKMRQLILENPDMTLEEIKESMGLDICLSAIHRIIRNKLGFTYKKRQYTPANETGQM